MEERGGWLAWCWGGGWAGRLGGRWGMGVEALRRAHAAMFAF